MFTYSDAMKYIEDSTCFGSVLGLENIKELLKELGNPQDKLRFVHVAGTNGKGSVCTYVSSILKEAGYKVGRYISPTIFHYRERIQTEEDWISEESFTRHMEWVTEVINKMTEEGKRHPTVFEIETAVAFLEFVRQKCDVAVLEVGLGGRLDSTNIITTADCGVFSSVSMDHMGILGNTQEEIAREKAGIIKKGMEVVSYEQIPAVEQILKETCEEQNGRITFVDFKRIFEVDYTLEKTSFIYTPFDENIRLETVMLGEHQVKNAAVAVEVGMLLRKKGYHISKEDIQNGIKNGVWEGRFSVIHRKPYVIVDGAHNEEASIALAQSINLYFGNQRIIRVIGVFEDKEYEKIIRNTVKENDLVYTVRPDNIRALSSGKLAEEAGKYCKNVMDAKDIEKALDYGLEEAESEDVILIYGSLSIIYDAYNYFR